MDKLKIELIAKTAHEVNKAFCEGLGDTSQVSWEEAPLNIKSSAIDGVKSIIDGKVVNPGDSHKNWLEFKKNDGWVYGEVKDLEKKTHPCFVSYDELKPEDKIKDLLFVEVVKTLLEKYKEI
jgi:hypothetical protein